MSRGEFAGSKFRPPRGPTTGVDMAINFEQYQSFGKEQFEALQASATEVSKQLQAIAAETTDYSKRSLESGSAFVEKLLGVTKFEQAIALQQDFAKSTYEGFVAEVSKLGELYANVAKEAFKPVEGAIAKVKASAN
ncbi:phasin family protein [Rhodoblastus sp.]|uniref:phasin family protein n=1 Tax=Rhodoblastus sp. TaxID=1962975 RepID=UPI0035B28C86